MKIVFKGLTLLVNLCSIILSMYSVADQPAKGGTTLQVVTEEYWPYSHQENGRVIGSSTQIIRLVLERANIPYQIRVYPWARAYKMAREKKNVLIYSMYRIPARESSFHWLGKMFDGDSIDFYSLNSADIKVNSIEQLTDYTIASQRESASAHFIGKHKFRNIREVANIKQCIGMLLKKRVKVVLANRKYIDQQLALFKRPSSDVKKLLPGFKAAAFFAMNKSADPALVEKIRRSYAELIALGKIQIEQQ